MAAFTDAAFTLTGADEPERMLGAQATASFFDVMGVTPVVGRVFTEANEVPGQDRVIVISQSLWQRRVAGSGDAVGRTITLNGQPHKQIVGDIERSLLVLMAAVGFVLLIACANLGNLMLGKAATRRKELAIRTALGARRGRLIRQIVTETLMLALAGSVLGLLLAYWAGRFFIAIGGESIPRPEAIALDARVMAFAFVVAIVAALLAGLVPALQASRSDVVEHLREGGREGGTALSRRTRSALVAAEVALAFVLLAGAGLLLRVVYGVEVTDPLTFVMMAAGLVAVAAAACWIPARRATRVDPLSR